MTNPTRITLTQTALQGNSYIEAPCRLDPAEIMLQEKGTQRITAQPIIGQPYNAPCTIITFKNGKQISVKEDFAQIDIIIDNA